MNAVLGLLLFAGTAWVGFRVLRAVPPLLHTPLMSGMNALSGITVLAAMTAWITATTSGHAFWAGLAVALAMANVTGGFLVTHRMLNMFRRGPPDPGAGP
jgi:H+-translocating NAD(P) transhydrogenase subunit alpha